MPEITYEQAGVSTSEGARAVDAIREAVAGTRREEVVGGIGGFGGLFSIAAAKNMQDPLLVSGTDGVGTKLALAQRFDRPEQVGIDLVAMCANDIVTCGAQPLFFLDYIAIGHIQADQMSRIVGGIAQGCCMAGCALVGGEMAEHPGVMAPSDYDLSGFCVGLVDRPEMIGPEKVREGDAILGLASSGIHSNGYSLVRAALTDGASDEELLAADESLEGRSLIDCLLEPTRIYVKSLLAALSCKGAVHSAAHITGGGITENLDRALPAGLDASIELGSWDIPPIINHVAEAAGLSQENALKTFNCGIGMAVVCDKDRLADARSALEDAGESVFEIGEVVSSDAGGGAPSKVVYSGSLFG